MADAGRLTRFVQRVHDEVLDFTLNINPCGAPRGSLDAAVSAVNSIHLYPSDDAEPLRAALASHHDIPQESVACGSGVDELIKLVVHAWTRPGDSALVHVPTFARYEAELRSHGVEVIAVEGPDPWHIDVPRVIDVLESREIRLAFVCLPNNPTGATMGERDLNDLVRRNPHTRFAVDEAMIYPPERGMLDVALRSTNAIVLRTFSKYYGLAGLRIGYAAGPPNLVASIEAAQPPFTVTRIASVAAIAALADIEFLERSKRFFESETELFVERLRGVDGCEVMSPLANLVLVKFEHRDVGEVVERLGIRGLRVRDAREYHGLEQSGCVRISLLDSEANARLTGEIRTICESS